MTEPHQSQIESGPERAPERAGQAEPEASWDLTRHLQWMRSLARALVRDEALAEDLVQDTAVAALRPGTTPPAEARAWLGTILRNRARDATRRRTARREREELASRPESSEDGRELEARAAMGAELSRRVLALDEPMRSTLLMRFWDGLPPRVIAKRQGVPVATVKSRLARGLERIRRDLDASHGGDRRAWVMAVLPLARKTPFVAVPAVGWTLMNAKLTLSAAAVVFFSGAMYLLRSAGATEPSGITESTAHIEPGRSPGTSGPNESRPRPEAMDAPSAPRTSASTAPSMEPPVPQPVFQVTAKVVDGNARALSGVEIQVEGDDSRGRTSADGQAALTTRLTSGSLIAASTDQWVTVRPGSWRSDRESVPLVVLAPSLRVTGRIIDEFGFGIENAQVDVRMPGDFLSRFDASFGASTRSGWSTSSGEGGAFSFDGAPAVPGATMLVTREGYGDVRLDGPMTDQDGVTIVMGRPEVALETALKGRVLRADGQPATDARVALGYELVATNSQGLFTIDLSRTGSVSVSDSVLTAIEAGSLAGELRLPASEETSSVGHGWPSFVEVRLGGAPLEIRGQVVNELGQPLADARLWLRNPTEFGTLGRFPLRREGLSSGFGPSQDAVRSLASMGELGAGQEHGSATAVGPANATLAWVVSGTDGRFRIQGLEDRDYELNVVGPNLDYAVQTQAIAAGSKGVTIVAAGDERHEEIRGRVVTRLGDPVPGVFITPWISAVAGDFAVADGSSSITRYFYGGGATTDEDGAFILKSVPSRWTQFYVAGQGIVPSYGSVEDIDDPADYELTVGARFEVSVEILDPELRVNAVLAVDEEGRPVPMLRIFADGYSTLESIEVTEGRTGVFALEDRATSLRLLVGERTLEEIVLDWTFGEVLKIQR